MPTNPRRANGYRRDRVCAQVFAEETSCWLCGGFVDQALAFVPGAHGPKCGDPTCTGCRWDPLSKTVDEVVPVSRGGSPFDRQNCRLAHRCCNISRGCRDVETRRPVLPLTTTRSW